MSVETQNGFGLDETFELLKSSRRRTVIEHLDENPVADFADVVDAVAETEEGERKTTYVGLYQTHIPKLDDHGVIEWDRDAGTISRGPCFSSLVDTLRRETGERGFVSRLVDAF